MPNTIETQVELLKKSLSKNFQDYTGSNSQEYSRHLDVVVKLFRLKRSNFNISLIKACRTYLSLFLQNPYSIRYIFLSFIKMILSKVL